MFKVNNKDNETTPLAGVALLMPQPSHVSYIS